MNATNEIDDRSMGVEIDQAATPSLVTKVKAFALEIPPIRLVMIMLLLIIGVTTATIINVLVQQSAVQEHQCVVTSYQPLSPNQPPRPPASASDKDWSLDPAAKGNAPVGVGLNEDPGPGVRQPSCAVQHPPSTPYQAPAPPK